MIVQSFWSTTNFGPGVTFTAEEIRRETVAQQDMIEHGGKFVPARTLPEWFVVAARIRCWRAHK